MARLVLAISFCMLIQACTNSTESRLKERLKRDLIDPDSAQFRDTELSPNRECMSGQVNSKNRMGGYVGFKKFFVSEKEVILSKDEYGLDVSRAILDCFSK